MRDSPPPAGDERFRFRAGRLSLDFCATVVGRHQVPTEQLHTAGDLARWAALAGLGAFPQGTGLDDDCRAARDLREATYRLVDARVRGAAFSSDDVATVNAAATHPTPIPQLSPDGSADWNADEPAQATLAAIARDAIELLTGPLAERIRECGSDDCSYVFIDTSRSARRRWCSMDSCGNREHVRQHRSRPRTRE